MIDCFPEPPTPTRRALPQGVRIIREILGQKQVEINTSLTEVKIYKVTRLLSKNSPPQSTPVFRKQNGQ